MIRSLYSGGDLPWLVFGDFNKILYHNEKRGGWLQLKEKLDDFPGALMDCKLMNLGYVGTPFTSSNRHVGEGFICERLDRFVGNGGWCTLFPRHRISHGSVVAYSDHILILISTKGESYTRHQGHKSFHFEEIWVGHLSCNKIIKASWRVRNVRR